MSKNTNFKCIQKRKSVLSSHQLAQAKNTPHCISALVSCVCTIPLVIPFRHTAPLVHQLVHTAPYFPSIRTIPARPSIHSYNTALYSLHSCSTVRSSFSPFPQHQSCITLFFHPSDHTAPLMAPSICPVSLCKEL